MLFSSAVHVAVLIVLALICVAIPSGDAPVISGLLLDEPPELPVLEVTDDFKAVPTESTHELNAGGQSIATPYSAAVARTDLKLPVTQQSLVSPDAASQPWSDVDVSRKVDILGSAVGSIATSGDGTGNGAGQGDGAGAFFGLPAIGKRFVFVLDCSDSMNHPHDSEAKSRFKRMKIELVNSVATMNPEMQFFIVFFNDTAIPMPASGLAQATDASKQNYLTWASKVKAIGNTEPVSAIQLAMNLNPDVIYFLTDGSFEYRIEQELLKLPAKHTVVHTFAFKETFSEAMLKAYDLIDQDKNVAARNAVSKLEFTKARAIWKAHNFLQKMADKHKGAFHIIP
ncbi:MAG: VWA domain-containing protein [Planctomycetota bacterium]|nr:VWA domain-containing protein [Planctomycetota bacterium]